MGYLVLAASVLLILSLILAWVLTGIRILQIGALKRMFPSDDQLLRAHIDYVLMSLLLYAFFALGTVLPTAIIALMIFGASVNPLLFFLLALQKKDEMTIGPVFKGLAFTSFISATVGFSGAAVLVALEKM